MQRIIGVIILYKLFISSLLSQNVQVDMAQYFAFKGKPDSAIVFAQKAIDSAKNINNYVVQVKSMDIIASSLLQKGLNDSAIIVFNQAIEIAKQSNDTLLLAKVLHDLSLAYSTRGSANFSKALSILLESAKLQESVHTWNSLPITYKDISVVFKEMDNRQGRIKYLEKAKTIIENYSINDSTNLARIYNELGRYYTDEDTNLVMAEMYFDKVLKISEEINWTNGIAVSLTNKAQVLMHNGAYIKALELHKKNLELKKEMQNVYGLINSYHSIGEVFLKQNMYDSAISNLIKAKDLAYQTNNTNQLNSIYQTLYSSYKRIKNYNLALVYFEKFENLADSLKGNEQIKVVEELRTKYEIEKKEQEILKLTQQQQIIKLQSEKKTRNLIISSIVSVFIVFVLLMYSRYRRLQSVERESNLNQKLLRTQMNPHFIFNSLNSINTYIIGNKPSEAGIFLSRFAKLMRNILDSSRKETITLTEEMQTISYYLQLEKLRFNNSFTYEIVANNIDDTDDIDIPPMLIQPLVENAIKHGINRSLTGGFINVKIEMVDETFLYCSVSDNGLGIDQVKKEKSNHNSYGLSISKERLQILNKKRSGRIELKFIDLSKEGESGTRVELVIPI